MADPTPKEIVLEELLCLYISDEKAGALIPLVNAWVDAAVKTETRRWSIGLVDDPEIVRRMIEDRAKAEERERIKKSCPWCLGKQSVGRLDDVEECETCNWIVDAVQVPTSAPLPETEDWFTEKCREPEFVKAYLEEQRTMAADDLRDAVKVEQERCAKVDYEAVECPFRDCGSEAGFACMEEHSTGERIECPTHPERCRAAIRAPE